MTDSRSAEQTLRRAVERFGTSAFLQSDWGTNIVADVVGGEQDLYRHSRALELALDAIRNSDQPDQLSLIEEILTEGKSFGIDRSMAAWALRVWQAMLEVDVAPDDDQHDQPADAADGLGSTPHGAVSETSLLPLVIVGLVVAVLVAVILFV